MADIGAIHWILSSEVFLKEVAIDISRSTFAIIMSEKQCSKFMVSYAQYIHVHNSCIGWFAHLHVTKLVADTRSFHFIMIAVMHTLIWHAKKLYKADTCI